ncbi:MAG: phosphate/phosphite/phosphonate ABC transporter substrate-binding protein [Geobacteraceae bacterium]|nr:phosphate/phosphite/phosphonate ABC transporter substrate-binding protein [Geobacteraceae bacterium]
MCGKVCKFGAAITLFWILALLPGWPAPPANAAEVYTFGVVPQYDQRQLFATWKPILDELGKRTGLSFRLVSAATISAFEKECLKGVYDFVYLNPYLLLKAEKPVGYQPIIRDRTELRGILVVRKDSPFKSPSELNGKTIAFPSPNALGASLLMRAELSNLFHIRFSPLYVSSHDSVYLYVAKGLAEAGGGVEKTLHEQKAAIRDALKVIYVTRPMPSHPVAVHPRVAGRDAEKVRRAFIEMEAAPSDRELLAKIPMNHPVSAAFSQYTPMRKWGLDKFWVKE